MARHAHKAHTCAHRCFTVNLPTIYRTATSHAVPQKSLKSQWAEEDKDGTSPWHCVTVIKPRTTEKDREGNTNQIHTVLCIATSSGHPNKEEWKTVYSLFVYDQKVLLKNLPTVSMCSWVMRMFGKRALPLIVSPFFLLIYRSFLSEVNWCKRSVFSTATNQFDKGRPP